ncbi:general transcription factor 3C polypeptide 1 [Trichonephila clavata]|uniref:General transcription factor 3C polypeptide 1 n=1 Tax=Trichonephila clavata TaxID=2740835 RepID=A0A8X6GNI5_TRICU|nr:general transcription factor 3C polypeptide 1 [Trichonephila clavata]
MSSMSSYQMSVMEFIAANVKKMSTTHDFMSSLLDEIALEGLDGITLEMLWQRLKDRPNFPITVDEQSKEFFWDKAAKHKDIEIYELPKPRKFQPIYNRYDHVDPELDVVVEPAEKLYDPYFPIVPVKDGDVRGSCATYNSRRCITTEIRCDNVLFMPLSQAVEKWGDALVLVASPKVRLLSLIGTETNPLIDLSLEAYCLLERIGRSRYLGEVTQGEGGLLALKASFCKQLHYYRKKLTLKGLITKQNHYMKNKKGTTCTGSLFHLTRFYVQRRTKMATWMKRLCDILKDKPLNREACRVLKEEMHIPDRTFKKLFYRPFQKWVKLITLTCKEFYPNGTTKDWYSVLGHEKIIKVVQLLRHCDDVDMDEKDEEGNDDKGVLPLNVHFDPSRIYFGQPLVYQLYCHIKDAGPEGISAADLGRTMTLPRLDIRCLLGLLSKKGHIITVLQDRGRQKVKKYIAKMYANQNKDYSSLKEQDVIITKEVISINGETVEQNSVKRKDVDIDEDINTPASKRTKSNEVVEKPVDDNKVVQNGNRSVEVESNYQNIVSQVLELQNKSHFTGKAPKLVNFVENPNVPPAYSHTSSQVTYRKLKRSNIILDHLKKEHFSTISDLQKHITEKEKEENYSFKLDKKSTARLVYSLYNSKKLKIFKAVLKLEDEQIEIEFICDNDVQSNDPQIQVAIEQAKFKYFGVSKESNKKGNAELKPEATSQQQTGKPTCIPVKNAATKEKSLKKAPSSQQPPPDTAHKNLRMTPKFIRAKVLHTFLYYMVYKHKGNPGNSDEQRIYHESISWKRFVPPLPDYGKEGWCFLTDIYSCMPLSLFIKIVNFRQGIPNLNHYIENEEKSHYLIKFLPQNLRNSLLNNRKYLFSTNDVIKVLGYMGLVSVGPQVGKQKDQIFLYVHKRASIKDTTISPTGYLHISTDINYEVKSYIFEHEEDVETFWIDLESISFHTPLGKYSSAVGKTISITEASFKPELVGAIKNKGFDEIIDVGTIPGDGLGAGGFDSILFLHCRRNWQAAVNTKSTETTRKGKRQNTALVSIQNLLKNTETANSDCRTRLHRLTKNTLLTQKEQKSDAQTPTTKKMVSKPMQPVGRKTTRLRTVQLRPNKKRAPYYDEKDRDAMRKMDKARCSWSSQEDSYLLLCKVASSFLDPLYCKNLVVPYTVVRDLLHKQVPEMSANKSSRACQRRVRYMMLNSATINNVNVFLGEALQDTELVREFNKPKPPKSNEEAWREMFTAVMNRLLEKFTMPASDRCKNITIPNNLKELYDNFVLECYEKVSGQDKLLYQEPKCIDDIKKFVLTSLVLSALAIVHDGTKWSYLLHKLYQSFPENAVMSVVNFLREESIVAIKRRTHKIDMQRSLQSTGPYKFSVTYSNAMLTKFPVKIFKESEDLLHNLKSVKPGTYVEVKGDVPPGYAAAVISLMQMGQLSLHTQIPSQIILFDSSLSQEARTNIVERMINTLSDKESVELSRLLNAKNTSFESSNKENVTKDKSSAVEDVEMLDSEEMPSMDQSLMNSSQMSEVQRFASASRFALYLLRQEMSQPPIERVQHSQDYIVLNSCQVYCHLKSDNDFDLPINPIDVIDKEFDEQKIEDFTHISKDKMRLTNDQIMKISHLLTSFVPSKVFDSNQNYLNHVEVIYQHCSSETQQEAKYIFSFIYDSGIIGVTEEEIWQKFKSLTNKLKLFDHLKIFRETNLVIRVGVNSFTYVCGCFAKNWVLTSCPLSDLSLKKGRKKKRISNEVDDVSDNPNILVLPFCKSDFENDNVQSTEIGSVSSNTQDGCACCIDEMENNLYSQADQTLSSSSKNCSPLSNTSKMHFIPRTWRNPDGSLNKPVFFNLLSTILSHIISLPGVSSTQVCEQFALVLPPVQILELIEILENACCIYKYYSKPLKRTSLFSPPGIVKITTNVQPGDMEHLEPFPDAICKMADFRNTMK